MRKFGLIGYPLGHSFSKGYFENKFKAENINDCTYENFPLEKIEKLRDLIFRIPDLTGLNVTIPYKEQVMSFIDELDPEADRVGAVNTIRIYRSANEYHLKGYNTDIIGFEKPLTDVLKPIHNAALVLGTGGASKAVVYVLKKQGINYQYVSRVPKNASILSYSDLTPEIISSCKIIINTSPSGMYPHIDNCPQIPYNTIGPDHILYDLIYNPEMTLFLKRGKEKKATLINGLPMLYGQAEESWKIWNG